MITLKTVGQVQRAVFAIMTPLIDTGVRVLIPEKITLDLYLMNHGAFQEREKNAGEEYCVRLGNFFELSRETIQEYYLTNQKEGGDLHFPQKSIHIPIRKIQEFNQLAIFTEIQVFGEDRIYLNESGLTVPLMLENLSSQQQSQTINIRYTVDDEPGIDYHWI